MIPGLYRWPVTLACMALLLGLSACNSSKAPNALSEEATLGQLIFFDASLSASGQQSCGSCHVPNFGHAQANALPAQQGGADMLAQGHRTAPSLRYLAYNQAFEIDDEGKARGGFFWDGRAQTLAEQAKGPFLNPIEMANPDVASLIRRLTQTPYAEQFRKVFGNAIDNRPEEAFEQMARALEMFQREDPSFRPFNSRFDQYLQGQTQLTAQEKRGLDLFKDPKKGNCAACHSADNGAAGHPPLFTDFSYDNLGLPRNIALTHNTDPGYFDLGLCAREKGDLLTKKEWCGAFKVPSLRNVAVRQAYFHNGQFRSLRDVLLFYAQRDTHPEKWYPRKSDGTIDKFNDLPGNFKTNVNTEEAPYDRSKVQAPAMNDAQIEDVLAFLRTLTDADLKAIP